MCVVKCSAPLIEFDLNLFVCCCCCYCKQNEKIIKTLFTKTFVSRIVS